jgi:hypothetical protein
MAGVDEHALAAAHGSSLECCREHFPRCGIDVANRGAVNDQPVKLRATVSRCPVRKVKDRRQATDLRSPEGRAAEATLRAVVLDVKQKHRFTNVSDCLSESARVPINVRSCTDWPRGRPSFGRTEIATWASAISRLEGGGSP